MIKMDDIPVPCAGIASRELDDEVILIAEDSDELHTLSETGKFIWKKINGKNSILALLDSVCSQFDVKRSQAQADLKQFINNLKDKEIILIKEK